MGENLLILREFNTWAVIVRIVLAVLCGGIIGIERETKRRPAGYRTHTLVCLGATMTMLTSQYLMTAGWTTDPARLGAQVVAGIGFIGAGTIIVTRRRQVKGLTTAAGLWASACMGIAIGAGFYLGAILGGAMILLSITAMRYVERFMMSRNRNLNIYVEFDDINDIGTVIDMIKSEGIRIFDIEISKADANTGAYASAVFSMRLPQKQPHSAILAKLAGCGVIRGLEEI